MGKPEELALAWNGVVRGLVQARDSWEKFSELASVTRADKLPMDLQKILAKVNKRAKFPVMLSRLIDHWRAYGGLEVLLVTEGKRKEKKDAG